MAAPQPRAQGAASVGARVRDGRSVLDTLYQQGSAKVLLPRTDDPALEAVLLNTAGGITGGDRLAYAGAAGPGARLILTTQAAERAYRAQPGETGRVETTLALGPGARIDWLPQETILFDRSALHRRLTVEMAADATLLVLETILIGRAAMGETVGELRFRDDWRIRRGGALLAADALRIEGSMPGGPATLDGARAFATLLYAAPDAEDRLDAVRDRLPSGAVRSGASAWGGRLSLRAVAPDGLALRAALADTLTYLLGRALPRVWQL